MKNIRHLKKASKQQPINIAMICDENFAVLTKNCIRTIILTKHKETTIKVYIIGVDLTEKTQNNFLSLTNKSVQIHIINKSNDFANIAQAGHRVSPAALFKFQLPDIIFEDKCLYLDGDIAVLDDLSDLYHTNIENKYAAMAIDWVAEKRQKDHIRLQHRNYFNSGVMLLNLKKMRKDNITEKLLTDKKNDTFHRYMDQDAFNRVLYPDIVLLDEKYNFHEEYDKLKNKDENYAYLKTINNIVCRHYTKYKPTQDLKFPHSEQFWQYGDITDFMKVCIKNMRDDYGRMYQHFDDVRKENEKLKKSIQQIDESIKILKEKKSYSWFKELFYCRQKDGMDFMILKFPVYSYQKNNAQEKVKFIGIPVWKSIWINQKSKRKKYVFGMPYKTEQYIENQVIKKWFGVIKIKKINENVSVNQIEIKQNLANGIYECYNKNCLPILTKDKLNIAFLICGGLGDICIAANYLWYFRNHFANQNIQLDVYVRNDFKMVQSIFSKSHFINRIFSTFEKGKYFDIQRDDIEYDLFIRLVRFPDVLYKKSDRLKTLDLDLYSYVNDIEEFKQQYRAIYSNDRLSAEFSLLRNQTRLQQADVNSKWNMSNNFSYILSTYKNDYKFLFETGLLNKKIITIHREVDLRLPENGVKLWSQDNYEKVISLLKKRYRQEIVIVQIGGDANRSPLMKGVHKYFVGKISFDETKTLLKNAVLHFDCEGGFVHLQKAVLGKGLATVLFGPTDDKFYGYKDNINISTHICKPCENLSSQWFVNCSRTDDKCICMKSITPQMVADRIIPYLDQRIKTDNKCKLLSLVEAKKLGYKELYFSFDGVGDTLLFRTAVEEMAKRNKKKVLIGTKRYELFEDSEYVDILFEYNESSFNQRQYAELENARIKPVFITGVHYVKDKELGWRRQWPEQHLLTSLCGKLGIKGKIEIGGHLELSEIEKAYGRFFPDHQIAVISKGMSEYKTIPLSVMQEVVDRLSDKYHFVQLGSEKDPLLKGVTDKRDCSDLKEAAAVLYNSDLYVGGIGGLMHLARFVGTRSVIAYSHGEPKKLVHYACNADVYPKSFGCNACSKGLKFPYQVKCNAECIKGITADELIAAIEKQMAKIGQPLETHYENVIPQKVKGLEEFLKKHGQIKGG